MTNLTATAGWDAVPQIDTTTALLGGPGGPLNRPAQALLNRSEWLRAQMSFVTDPAFAGGADPSGVLDSTTAILAAIASGKPLVWPEGTYKLTQPLSITNGGHWLAFGAVSLSFSGISSGADWVSVSGGALYKPTHIIGDFSITGDGSGRYGLALLNGDHCRIQARISNAGMEGFAIVCDGYDWVENARLDIYTEGNGRHGTRLEVKGSNGAFINECVLRLEVRGVSRRASGGNGIYAVCSGTDVGSKISALHIEAINLDAMRGTAVANGFDIGQNPIYLDYVAGGTNKFEAWDIRGGGFETTNGSDDFRSQYLIYAASGVVAAYWDVRGIVPANWSSGDGLYGLIDAVFHSCKGNGGLASVTTFGNAGIGVQGSAWGSGFRAMEVGAAGNALFSSTSGACNSLWSTNSYFDGGNWRYARSQQASHYEQVSGTHNWNVAATGTAGAVVTWKLAMSIDNNGNVIQRPNASAAPSNNGDMMFELTSNTQLKIKVKGSDGVVRSTSLTLA
jgi:hypothetical protein